MAIVNAADIWGVGYYQIGANYLEQTLTAHWDGSQWSYVQSPSPAQRNWLNGVAAVSANDVWAVGRLNPSGPERTLTVHWDGISWSVVPSPNPSIVGDENLFDVSALSSDDIWAVGWYYQASGTSLTLAIHWDGQTWNVVPTPNPGGNSYNNSLYGISALAPNDIWAVGYYNSDKGYHSLMLHWDGSQWSSVPSPDPAPYKHQVFGVAAISTDDVWAVGVSSSPAISNATLTLHWDGRQWSVVSSPNFDSQVNYLAGVTGTAWNDAWAVGWAGTATLALHWDGVQWSRASSENVAAFENRFYGVEALNANEAWVVGNCLACYGSGGSYRTLVEHYTGPCSTPTSTPKLTPTRTPTATASATSTVPRATSTPTIANPSRTPDPTQTIGGLTATPLLSRTPVFTRTPIAATATPTLTICPIQFTDVPQGSTFYPYIMCLACRGIVTGYADGTFRPGNNVTRRQAAKIISLSADYQDPIPPDRQTFNDVAPASTFWEYIERVALHGAISGYVCGGEGEPCPGRYFRPANNLTRGQLAKIDSEAFGYSDHIPPDRQTFNDVAPGSTFWVYVERLALHNIVSGYTCGGEEEPCPGVYYRPANNITRGQVSKVVANTFFPQRQPPPAR